MYIVHGPLENMVYFFYRNYHIFSVVRLSYDVKNLADLRGCYPEEIIVNFSKDVFERRTSTGSGFFFIFGQWFCPFFRTTCLYNS